MSKALPGGLSSWHCPDSAAAMGQSRVEGVSEGRRQLALGFRLAVASGEVWCALCTSCSGGCR